MTEPDRPVRALLVGAGAIADAVHLPAVRELGRDQIEVVGVVDIDQARAASFAERWGIPVSFVDLRAALHAVAPDLAIVCTPPGAHPEQVRLCLTAGVDVWCEKPPALSLQEYDGMMDAQGHHGPYAAIVFQNRYGSGMLHARSLLDSGLLGRPLVAHCQTTWYRDDDYFDAPWRGSFDGDGGPSLALGIHQLDLLLELMGEWSLVTGIVSTSARRIETGDTAAAAVLFENGAIATVLNSAVSPREESVLRVDTERATIELHHLYSHANADWTITPAPGVTGEESAQWINGLDDTRSTHAPQLRRVVADLRSGERPATSGDGGRRALELVTALHKSAATGIPVRRGEIVAGDPFYRRLDGGRQ